MSRDQRLLEVSKRQGPSGGPGRRWRRARSVVTLLAMVVTLTAVMVTGPATAGALASSCPSVDANWAAPGPFAVTSSSNGQGTTIFRPTNLGTLGCTNHPVVLWGNGAAASVSSYTALLTHLASHGFIVAASEGRSADPAPMLAGLDYLTRENARAGSAYAGKVDLSRVGATGHSLGGGQAVGTGADPRVDTVAPLMGGPFNNPGRLHGPALFFAGQFDFIVWPAIVRLQYNLASQVPAIYAELAVASHFEPGLNGGRLRGPLTAWLRFQLMGDEQARGLFFGPSCTYCTSSTFSDFDRNSRAAAIPGT